jgi:TatD DNase family protein
VWTYVLLAGMRLFDAHNHLQDSRFSGRQPDWIPSVRDAGLVRMVVNGACEEDWGDVRRLADAFPEVMPAFGLHPWYLHSRTEKWRDELVRRIDSAPGASVGEIGIDRWILDQPAHVRGRYVPELAAVEPAPLEVQEEVFVWQLRLAAERGVAASIHCLHAWGRLLELLKANPLPKRGFLLHSYGGPAEMIPALAKLGAYFGFPGYFLQERKGRQQEVFRSVPADRLLVETDAPDQLPPLEFRPHPLAGENGGELNHPANIEAIYRGLAGVRGEPVEELAESVAENFVRLFGTK